MSIKVMTAVWENGPSNSTQRFVLLALADYASDDGRNTYPAVETLAAKCALSERTVIRALEALVRGGYLVRRRRKDTTNLYQIVIERLRPSVSDNLSLTQVSDCHPGKCQIVTPVGDSMSPDPSLIRHSNRQCESSTATAAGEAVVEGAVDAAAGVPATVVVVPVPADPFAPILDWIGFDGALTAGERKSLTTSTLLAWAYWFHLKQAQKRSGVYNPVGLVRAQWRKQPRGEPRADFLRLARGWLAADDENRRALLDRLADAAGYDDPSVADPDFERDFPDVPPALAAAVYTATGGQLGPPSLMPPAVERPADEAPAAPPRPVPATGGPADTVAARLWRDALVELEMQMGRDTFRKWLAGTTATLDGDELTIHVRNVFAVDWLSGRLHDLITRVVNGVAKRPTAVRYKADLVPPAPAQRGHLSANGSVSTPAQVAL